MNRLTSKYIKWVGAAAVCVVGLLSAKPALASDWVRIWDLQATWGHGYAKIWGTLKGYHAYDVRVHFEVDGHVENLCINGGGKVVAPHTTHDYFSFEDYVYLGTVHGYRNFDIVMDPYDYYHYDHLGSCPPGLASRQTTFIEHAHVTVLRGYAPVATGDCWFDDYGAIGYCEWDRYYEPAPYGGGYGGDYGRGYGGAYSGAYSGAHSDAYSDGYNTGANSDAYSGAYGGSYRGGYGYP